MWETLIYRLSLTSLSHPHCLSSPSVTWLVPLTSYHCSILSSSLLFRASTLAASATRMCLLNISGRSISLAHLLQIFTHVTSSMKPSPVVLFTTEKLFQTFPLPCFLSTASTTSRHTSGSSFNYLLTVSCDRLQNRPQTLCLSSYGAVKFTSLPLEAGLGHVTCFGQQDISKCHAKK